MKPSIDRFSEASDQYQLYRPKYPDQLYQLLLKHVSQKKRAWDCATGNGQVALQSAKHFEAVEASDLSPQQLAAAPKHPKIRYTACRAEQTPFPDQHFDLITVAQALHWFDVPAFHREAVRVARPGCLLAEWGYGLLQLEEPVQKVIDLFYRNIIGAYWDPERLHIDRQYEDLPFPFGRISVNQPLYMENHWTLEHLLGYFSTWSAVKRYHAQHHSDPVDLVREALFKAWGEENSKLVRHPIFLRIGVI